MSWLLGLKLFVCVELLIGSWLWHYKLASYSPVTHSRPQLLQHNIHQTTCQLTPRHAPLRRPPTLHPPFTLTLSLTLALRLSLRPRRTCITWGSSPPLPLLTLTLTLVLTLTLTLQALALASPSPNPNPNPKPHALPPPLPLTLTHPYLYP